jgi:hypothetical protein
VISRRVCTQVGSTASVVFDYREGFLFCETAVDMEIAKEGVEVARKININITVLCDH